MSTPDNEAVNFTTPENPHSMKADNNADLIIARKIQQAMIPRILPESDRFTMASLYLPSSAVSGDQFDAIQTDEKIYTFLLFDVAGNGVSSALLSSLARVYFATHLRNNKSPKTIIEHVNTDLTKTIGEKFHLTAFLAFLDLHDNRLTYCNAGHPFPILYRSGSGSTAVLKTEGTIVGFFENAYYEEQSIFLEPDDWLFMFTDGVFQALNPGSWDTFEKTIINLMESSSPSSFISALKARCIAAQKSFLFEDDVAALALRMEPDSTSVTLKEMLGFHPNNHVYIQIVRNYYDVDKTVGTVLAAMDRAGYGDDSVRRMKISLPEIIINAIYHGNKKDLFKKVVVGHMVTPGEARVSILDEGDGFDPYSIPDPTLEKNLMKENGRGVYITRYYCDKVEWNESGNRTTLVVVSNNNRKA
ncbi:MAG: SpoIIE family protein phosphatase [Chitinispirillales bacterium]|jgi:anti-sigma regulatory factor (Ser/Thr protein kinase)|nr:SpoIIE family protein phosphatase [Chitinispirillales bacterium]